MSEPVAGVGAALGGTGAPCPSVTFCGRNWKVGWPTQDAKLWLELLVAQDAEDGLTARKRIYSAEVFARKQKELESDLRGQQHAVGGSIWLAAVNGPDCMPLFLLSLLKEHQPDATLADARVLWGAATRELRLAMSQVMPPFVALLVAAAPVPQEQKAALLAGLTDLVQTVMWTETPGSSPAPTG